MHLNGWQRIWVLISVFSGLFTIVVAITSTANTNRPEDSNYYLELLNNDVITVEIETVGKVYFPDSLSNEEIEKIVKKTMSTSPSTVSEVAKKELLKRAILKAAEARLSNTNAKDRNFQLYSSSVLIWLGFVIFVYIAGWSFSWVRRGFRET